jgi:hypothetical protein
MVVFNDHNSKITNVSEWLESEELADSRKKEVEADILDAISTVQFIRNLADPNIRKAKDLPKDEKGKIIVDLTNPHKLEDMDYFCQTRNFYKQYGVYTKLYPNKNPNSEYMRFWKREADRIRNGMIRESDGEWIPGELYFYWNYSPILLTRKSGVGKRADRVRDFPNVWLGDYLFFHYLEQARDRGEHCEVLKQRGIGWSYKGGALSPRLALFFKESRFFYTAFEKEYLIKDGVMNKAWDTLDFLANNTPFPRLRLKDTTMEKIIGYKDNETGAERGQKSSILGVTSKDESGRLRGKRGWIFFEEYGIFPNIKDVWNTCRDSAEDGENVFSVLIAGGTGGSAEADFAGAEDMFRYPDSYNIYGIPNVFDRNSDGKSKCGFFWGAYLNRANCYDDNGNPDVIKALYELVLERVKIKYNSSDVKALTQRKAEKPITPDECMLRVGGTMFPVADLKEHTASIELNMEKFVASHKTGEFVITDSGDVKFKDSGELYPIRTFPIKGNNRYGAVEIFELPKESSTLRYIVGVDTIDNDNVIDGSLGSAFVFDLITDSIVAEYTGRPQLAKEFYEIVYRLAKFYNAKINYENNIKGLYAYFDNKHRLDWLVDTPKILTDTQLIKAVGFGNKSKGTHATKEINSWGMQLLANWMLEDKKIVEEDKEKTILKLHTIRSIGLLKECIAWSPDINTDRISAMGMVMILRENYQKNIAFIQNPQMANRAIYKDKAFERVNKKFGNIQTIE